MERRLYEASLSGNVQTLNTLTQEDQLLLDRVTVTCFNETPLHIAALRGHLDFVRALLSLKPKLATELDLLGRSPLHLASAEGYANIVVELLHVSTDVGLVRDHQGRIPLHLAAMKGRVEVIDELVRARPDSTMVRLDRGETVLHLCVKYNQLGALKKLIESVSEDDELIGSVNDDGNTILHVATALKQMETIKYLVSKRGVKKKANALNRNGFTAIDVLEHCQGMEIRGFTALDLLEHCQGMEIREFLLEFGVRRANDQLKPLAPPTTTTTMTREQTPAATTDQVIISSIPIVDQTIIYPPPPPPPRTFHKLRQILSKLWNYHGDWLEDARGNLMVTATVIAAMAFQAGINPPGGFWQGSDETNQNLHDKKNIVPEAGTSVLGDTYPKEHTLFIAFNTVSFVASLTIILLMVSGFPLKKRLSMWLLIVTMSIAVTFMGFTYLVAVETICPWKNFDKVIAICRVSLYILFGVFALVVLIHAARIFKLIVIVSRKLLGVFPGMLNRLKLLVHKRRLLPSTTSTTNENMKSRSAQ